LLFIIELLQIFLTYLEIHFKQSVDDVPMVVKQVRIKNLCKLNFLNKVLLDLENLLE
jgi:hypothetical protein